MMSTPNLDVVGHCWVASLAGFNFIIEYLRGADNKVADALSQVGDRLELDMDSVCELLSHSNDPMVPRAETDDTRLMQEHVPSGARNHHAGLHAGRQSCCIVQSG